MKSRLQHNRAGKRDALALSAGEFMRVAGPRFRVEPDLAEGAHHPLLSFLFAHLGMMHP